MRGQYNIAGEPAIFDELFESKGKMVKYIPFSAVDAAAKVASWFSSKYKDSREWLQALKYQCIVNCDKIIQDGIIKELVPTRSIFDEIVDAKISARTR